VTHDHLAGNGVERDGLGGVGDVRERVARARRADVRHRRDDLPHLIERRRGVNRAVPQGPDAVDAGAR